MTAKRTKIESDKSYRYQPTEEYIHRLSAEPSKLIRKAMAPRRKTFNNGYLSFFRGFLRHPALIGSVIPSSPFLERRIVEVGDIAHSRSAVELGPGTGGTTRAILRALPRRARLLAIEISPDFVNYLKAYPDPRLGVYLGSAEHIRKALQTLGQPRPDVVVSGIPFSTIPAEVGRKIIREIWDCLIPGGLFVAYQLMNTVAFLEPLLLGDPHVQLELLNVPPLRVYSWCKPVLYSTPATTERKIFHAPSVAHPPA